MDLQPLTKAVLNPSLSMLLESSDPVIVVRYLPPNWVETVSETSLTGTIANLKAATQFAAGDNSAVQLTGSLNAWVDAFKAIDLPHLTNPSILLDPFRRACRSFFIVNAQLITGDMPVSGSDRRVFTTSQRAIMEQQVDDILRSIDLAIVAAASTDINKINRDLSTFTGFAENVITMWIAQNPEKVWILPDSLQTLLKYALYPWFVMKFAMSFVQDASRQNWVTAIITGINPKPVSFYDMRYATYLVYYAAHQTLRILNSYNNDTASRTTLTQALSSIETMMTAEFQSEIDGDSMRDMYNEVSTLSHKTRVDAQTLNDINNRMNTRKRNAVSVYNKVVMSNEELKDQRRRFYTWIVAYVVTVAIAVILLVTKKTDAFVAQSGIVLLVVSLYLLVIKIRSMFQSVTITHPSLTPR